MPNVAQVNQFPDFNEFLETLKRDPTEAGYDAPIGTVVAVNPSAAGVIDVPSGTMQTSPATSASSMKKENVAAVVSLGKGSYRVVYNDGTSSDLLPGYLESGYIGALPSEGDTKTFIRDDGTAQQFDIGKSSNFFSKISQGLGDALGDQTMRVIIPAAAIAVLAYSGASVAGGLAGGTGAGAGAEGAGLSTAAEMGGAGGGLTEGIGVPAGYLSTTVSSLPAGSVAALETGTGMSASQLATQLGKSVASLTLGDWLKVGTAALPVIGSLFADKGGQTVSTTSTTDTRPGYVKAGAEKAWNNFIDDFYGTGKTPSVQDRISQDTDYLKNLDTGYIDKTKAAAAPYQQLLSDTLNQATTGTGNFTPLSFGFGGQKMASFVPRPNRDTAAQTLGIGKEKLGIDTGLLDLENSRLREFTPNAAANKYSAALEKLMQLTNTGGTTKTETGTVPGPSTFSNILGGLNAGANLWNAFNYTPATQQPNGYDAEWAALKRKYGVTG